MTHHVVFIDAYDSFSNNIISLLETKLGVDVTVLKIDSVVPDLGTFLKPFTAVVVGPGPGNPKNPQDVGLIRDIWALSDDHILPVFGICLGFQSLVLSFGGRVEPLPEPRHGIETYVRSDHKSIFSDIDHIVAVQYHSLHGSLGHDIPESPWNDDDTNYLWNASDSCPDLQPLAWDCQNIDTVAKVSVGGKEKNPSCILMAVKHTTKPFYGVQFHPESICSNINAQKVVLAWWNAAKEWHRDREDLRSTLCVRLKSITLEEGAPLGPFSAVPLSIPATIDTISTCPYSIFNESTNNPIRGTTPSSASVATKTLALGNLTVAAICDRLALSVGETAILESEMRQMRDLGTHSILGVVTANTPKIEYSVGSHVVRVICAGKEIIHNLDRYGGSIFSFLKVFLEKTKAYSPHTTVSFWGGLMGYITYEACLETIDIDINKQETCNDRPDLSFAFIERSIVIDHETQQVYIQSIKADDMEWLKQTHETLADYHDTQSVDGLRLYDHHNKTVNSYLSNVNIQYPVESSYKAKIQACQKIIHSGDSYEMCLTNQAIIEASPLKSSTSWPLYLRLRALNPAPFSAYIHLGPLTLLSTSPERFMSWTRPTSLNDHEAISTCQFRPIKGTVRKQWPGTATEEPRTVTVAEATAMLSTTKERAENLMIVDLIRHDLHGVVGSGNVTVKELMVIEEYASVFQLVSVIEGTLITPLSPSALAANNEGFPTTTNNRVHRIEKVRAVPTTKSGIDVLAASLPPGSMTGAPKRRSCRLLRSIEEEKPRSIYSGVVGYMCVGGGGDFSVVIRSIFKWDDDDDKKNRGRNGVGTGEKNGSGGEKETTPRDKWHIGAGGAVTVLSTAEGEWEEMKTKLGSTIGLFAGEGKA